MIFIAYFLCILQDGLNVLHLAVIGNHVDIVRALVGEVGLFVTHRDDAYVSTKGVVMKQLVQLCNIQLNQIIWPEFLQAVTAQLRYEVKEEVAYGCRQVNCETEANREV